MSNRIGTYSESTFLPPILNSKNVVGSHLVNCVSIAKDVALPHTTHKSSMLSCSLRAALSIAHRNVSLTLFLSHSQSSRYSVCLYEPKLHLPIRINFVCWTDKRSLDFVC